MIDSEGYGNNWEESLVPIDLAWLRTLWHLGILMSKTGSFTCANCNLTFDKIWSDEEALAEANEIFSREEMADPEGLTVLCDDCWRTIGKTRT